MTGSYEGSNEISDTKKENVADEQLKCIHIPVLLQPKTSIIVIWVVTMYNVANK